MSELQACYDLQVSPPTYDFVGFLLAAEMERLKFGLDGIDLHVLPGPAGGFRADRLPPFTIPERVQMRDRIVVPMAGLLPSCRTCTVHEKRRRPGKFGFEIRRYGFPEMLAAARADVYPLRAQRRTSEPYVTITFREATYWPTRNSNLAEWLITARWLRQRGHRAIVIRDTAKAGEPFEDFEIDPEASRNLVKRAELYAGAELNLFTNNGPAWLAMFLGAPCLIFKLTAPDAGVASDAAFRQWGFPRGSIWPNAKPRQAVLWTDDDSDAVISAIEMQLCES